MYAVKFYNSIRRNNCYATKNVFSLGSMHVTKRDTILVHIIKKRVPLFGRVINRGSSNQLKFCSQVEEVINKQISAEQQAAQDYLSIAVLFLQSNISQLGAGGYFMKMYNEELNHMQKFIQYQIMCGGKPIIKGIKEPCGLENITLLCAFKQAFTIENNITQLLENLVCVADSVKDYQCSDFVTSIFLREQRLTLNKLAHHITKLSRVGNDEHALYHYDLNLTNSCYVNKLEPKLKGI